MRRIIAGVIALIIFLPAPNYSLLASSEIAIVINGKEKAVNPGPIVTGGRVMVPLRFIIEDDALRGRVTWDTRRRQVTIYCRDRRFDFFIGRKTARLNGQAFQMDTAPYIFHGRAYIPIRFFSTQLGASVAWRAGERVVVIDFTKQRPRVFAYYYGNGFSELRQRANLLTDVAFRWYQTDGRGRLSYEYSDAPYGYKFEEVVRWAKDRGLKAHLSVMLFDRQQLSILLNSPDNRKNLIRNLKKVVDEDGYDGVNIDFEFIAPEDGDGFVSFLQELKSSLGSGKTVSVAVFPRTAADKWPTAYDYKTLGRVSDLVVVMAYDYSFEQPGPIAPLDWCRQVLDYAEGNIPREKILMGIGAYGYDWEGKTRRTVNQSGLAQLKRENPGQDVFNRDSYSPCFSYLDDKGHWHQVWYENRASLEAKLSLYRQHSLGGVAFWKMDGAFTDLYDVLAAGVAH